MLAVAYSEVWEGNQKLYEKYLEIYNRSLAILGSDGYCGSRFGEVGAAVVGGLESGGESELGVAEGAHARRLVLGVEGLSYNGDEGKNEGDRGAVGRGSEGCYVRERGVNGNGGQAGDPSRGVGEDVSQRGAVRGSVQLAGAVGERISGVGNQGDLSEEENVVREKTLRNRMWRKEKKERKVRKQRSWRRDVPEVVVEKSEAQKTLEAKWVIENKLKAAEAERKLELLKLQDVSEVAKLQERKLKAAGEKAMVQIEKSHATLAATGNVPGVVPKGGYCTTLVDDPGLSDGSSPTCTISPDSSASMHEYKQCLLALADEKKKNEDLTRLIKRREIMDKATYSQSVAEFTAGSESVLSDGLKCELDKKFGKSYEYDGKYEGKHVVRRVFDFDGMDDEDCGVLEGVY